MAYQKVGTGQSANDGTGDDLRTGAGKINANIEEVYAKINGVAPNTITDGTAITTDSVVLLTATQTLTNNSLTSPTITGTGAIAGTFTGNITGNVTGNVTGDLTGNISSASGNVQVDAATQILEIRGDGSSVEGQIVLNCHANSHGQTIKPQPHSANVTNTLLLPADGNSTLVSEIATQTLTNKTLTSPTITGTGAIAGVFTGNITGNVTGDVTGNVTGNVTGEITATGAVPASATATGTAGAIRIESGFVYFATGTDTWERVAIATF